VYIGKEGRCTLGVGVVHLDEGKGHKRIHSLGIGRVKKEVKGATVQIQLRYRRGTK